MSATGVIHGEILTRPWVVSLILDLTGYTANKDLAHSRIVEPAAGTGAFVAIIIDRLLESANRQGIDVTVSSVGRAIRAFDIQEENCRVLRQLVTDKLLSAGAPPRVARSLADLWVVHDDYLLPKPEHALEHIDVVVGNPPYIRMEDIPTTQAQQYRQAYPTMTGRADIYIAFFEAGLRSLRPEGKLAFICADRWMRNDYGKGIRRFITTQGFSIDAIITAHEADVFERQVDAYPAIVVLRHGAQAGVSIADTTAELTSRQAPALAKAVLTHKHLAAPTFTVGVVDHWAATGTEPWPHGSPLTIERLSSLDALPTIEETGARIGIGIATGADGVYVTNPKRPLPEIEQGRLLPLSHADDIRKGVWNWTGRYLVNPWEPEGLINLDEFPRMKDYLLSHDVVRSRNVAHRNPSSWWRTIDRVAYRLLDRPLILLQDMSQEVTPVIAPPGFYPHHNLYWIDVQNSGWDPEVLAGILLADQIREQIAARCVLMRGKTLRLQAQYLRQIHLPAPTQVSKSAAAGFRSAYKTRDRRKATNTLAGLLPA